MKPIDQDIRDAAVAQIDRSWALSAGAGSGKTTVLVNRTAGVLASGIPPSAVAAITFTEKAAREMEERVRDTLEEQLQLATGERAEHLSQALLRLSSLTITTIHAFCQELLQQEALTADWAPGSTVINEVHGASAIDIAFHQWRRCFDAEHPELALQLRALADRKQLMTAAKAVIDNPDLTLVRGAAEVDWQAGRAELAQLSTQLHSLAQQCQIPEKCVALRNNAELLATLTDCLSRELDETAVRDFLDSEEDDEE